MKNFFVIMGLLILFVLLLAFFEYRQIQKTVFVPPPANIFQTRTPAPHNFSSNGKVSSVSATPGALKGSSPHISPGARPVGADDALPSVNDLPKISDGRKYSTAEAQEMPAEILAKIEPLVRMNHLLRENPKLEPFAWNFYKKCAAQEDLMNAVRARCLNHLRKLARNRDEAVDLSPYSARLIRLSEFINL